MSEHSGLDPSQKLRAALELQALGLEVKRQQLRRAHPDAAEADIARRLELWLQLRPGERVDEARTARLRARVHGRS